MLRDIFSLSFQSTSRLAWIDYAKGMAIIMVVFRHLSIGLHRADISIDPELFRMIDELGLSFRMPLFFLLSGIFFRKSLKNRGRSGYLLHKSKTILYPYLLWSCLLTAAQMLLSGYTNTQAEFSHFLNVFIHPWGHWWFLYALFNVSVLYLLLNMICRGYRRLLFVLGAGMYFLAPSLAGFSVMQDVFNLFIFFVLGDLLSKPILSQKNTAVLSSTWLLLLFVVLATAGEWILFNQLWGDGQAVLLLFALLGSSCTIWLSYRLALWQPKALQFIRTVGQHSLYVYLLHAPIGAAIRSLFLFGLGVSNFWSILLIALPAALFLPIFIYRLCRLMGLRFLFSLSDAPKSTALQPVNS